MQNPLPPQGLEYATPQVSPQIRRVGVAQRRIMWIILGAILLLLSLGFGAAIAEVSQAAGIGAVIILVLLRLAMLVLMMMGIYELAAALEYGMVSRVLFVIGMLLPLIGLVVLLVVNQKATNLLKRNGIKVGLMGAKLSDLPQA